MVFKDQIRKMDEYIQRFKNRKKYIGKKCDKCKKIINEDPIIIGYPEVIGDKLLFCSDWCRLTFDNKNTEEKQLCWICGREPHPHNPLIFNLDVWIHKFDCRGMEI